MLEGGLRVSDRWSFGRACRWWVLLGLGWPLLVGCTGETGGSAAVRATSGPRGPFVAAIVPSAGPVGTAVTLTGSGFAPAGNTVRFGPGYIKEVVSSDGATLRFTVPEGLDLCSPDPREICAGGAFPAVAPGSYSVSVVNSGGTSNSVTFRVTRR